MKYRAFKYWLVREYPDVETLQVAILALLASGHTMMFEIYEDEDYNCAFTESGRRECAYKIFDEVKKDTES